MRIAIDAMGGDHAPDINIRGAVMAAKEWKDTELILVGDEKQIRAQLPESLPNIRIAHADEVIGGEEEPVKAVRRKKNASMVVAGNLVRENEADALVSAGNTGALMAAGLLVVGRIPGIERPALAPVIPTLDGKGVLALDLGANMDASPQQLLQYAVMGSIYRAKVLGMDRPRVGLLNVGTEPGKGNGLTKEAYLLLQEAPLHFIGNVEARDVLYGRCDVLVCDGFAGNVMLKTLEGAAEAIFTALKSEMTRSAVTKLAASLLKPGLKAMKKKMDYTEHGGAPLLGVRGVVIKGHGSSDANAIKNAVRQARSAIKNRLVEELAREFSGK